jgi:subtilisin family serine protease
MKKPILLALSLAIWSISFGQDFSIIIKLKSNENIKGTSINDDYRAKTICQKYESDGFIKCYQGSIDPELELYYYLQGTGKKQEILDELSSLGLFETIKAEDKIHYASCTNPEPPVNDTWIVQNWANNYALEMIEAFCAWSISKGSPNILIGIADTDFQLAHEDLENQIVEIGGSTSYYNQHGTGVAGCASAQTNNNKGIAGIGYNSKISAYRVVHDQSGAAFPANIASSIWGLYNGDKRIINVSWPGTGLLPNAALQMTQNGTVLVCSAGNDNLYEYHSDIANIPGVIVVSSVDQNNEHGPTNDAHNQYVDICAPGNNVTTTFSSNSYGGGWGTSYAAPLVAGTIALMLEVNPCLTPSEIELLIEESADPVADAQNFPGLLGAGRLNAFEAVMAAGTRNFNNHSFTGNQNLTAGFGFNLNNSFIGSSSNITLTARKEVNITGTFIVPVGSTFSIELDSNIQTNCQ